MDGHTFLLFAFLLSINGATSLWSCSIDSDCSSLKGSICNVGICECRPGSQSVLGGTVCVDIAPYHTSPCFEDYQCVRLFSGYHCRKNQNETVGSCMCLPGHHYFRGRCWRSTKFGDTCSRSEECMEVIRDPFSMTCNRTCQCSEGYYERQRGECRRAALRVNDSCVLNEDCQFPGGACNITSLRCIQNTTNSYYKYIEESKSFEEITMRVVEEREKTSMASNNVTVQRVVCNSTVSCPSPFECSIFGVCTCPLGYYQSANGTTCLAELGSVSTAAQCVGFMAEVFDGVCACRPNFFYEENMRDCVRVTRRLGDSCVSDLNCHTFGAAARCSTPRGPWGFRSCECIPELAVWDRQRSMCRYFAGIGETCEVNSDCLAGELEIQCVKNEAGQGFCACPEGMQEFEGLCLSSGLGLGDSCQHSLECTGTANTVCDGVCTCSDGYQDVGGSCAPAIGGACAQDSDCVIENTVCRNSSRGFTCQCDYEFVESNTVCWPRVSGFNSTCSVNAQCVAALGNSSSCVEGVCSCSEANHYRDGGCWPITGIFQPCLRTSQCFLADDSSRVVCRNSMCQCDFQYPYSEETKTCLYSSASHITIYITLLIFPALSIILR